MTMKRWLIAAAIICVATAGCRKTDAEVPSNTHRLQQAGPPNSLATADHLAGTEAAALTGDQRTMQRNGAAMHTDMMRFMHLPAAGNTLNLIRFFNESEDE